MKIFNVIARLVASITLVLWFTSCASVQGDPLIVRAEQVRKGLQDTIRIYSKYEYENAEALWKISKDFKHAADALRTKGPVAIGGLSRAISSYKLLKNSENKQDLLAEVKLVSQLLSEGLNAYADAKAVTP